MGGSSLRSPDGWPRGSDSLSAWWLGLAPDTLEFWVRFPNERNQGKQTHPVLKYRARHGSQPRHGWAPDPRWLGLDPLSAWWLGLAPVTLEFWVRFPNERNQGKQAHPVLKYRVPHGSQPRHGWAPDPRGNGWEPWSVAASRSMKDRKASTTFIG